MNPTTPMALAALVLLFHQVGEEDLTPQPWIALVGLWLLLGFLANSMGDLAALLAWLVAIGMVYVNGKQLLDMVQKATGQQKGKQRGRG